jgi:TonB family protein
MILPLKTFLVVTELSSLACNHVFAGEPRARSLAGVPRVTRDQMWIASPEPKYPTEGFKHRLTDRGLFNLKIRPKKYTVSQVTVLQSTGHQDLDAAAIEALSRWRGRSSELMSRVDHVRVPVTFTLLPATFR